MTISAITHPFIIHAETALHLFFLYTAHLPPRPPLFPYTTLFRSVSPGRSEALTQHLAGQRHRAPGWPSSPRDRSEDTRLNSSHEWTSYAVFCLKKKNKI